MSDIPAEVDPSRSESSASPDADRGASRVPERLADLSDRSSPANGATHAPSDLVGTLDGGPEGEAVSNGHVPTEDTPHLPTVTPPTRQRRRRIQTRAADTPQDAA